MLCSTTLRRTERLPSYVNHLTESSFDLVRTQETPRESVHPERSTLLPQSSSDAIIQISTNNQGLQSSSLSSSIALAKQASFLRKICGMLLSFIMWTILIKDEEDNDNRLENLYFMVCLFLMYGVFEDVFFCFKQELSLDNHKEALFDVLDGFLGLCFMLGIFFKKTENLSNYLLVSSSCFFLISTSLYVKCSRTLSTRNLKILRKLFCTLQTSLITVKMLGYISLNWTFVLLPLGFSLIFKLIYGSYTVVRLMLHFCKTVRDAEIDSSYLIKACLKITWFILFNSLSPFAFGILVQFCCGQTEDEENKNWASTSLMMAQYYCSFFFGYALIFFKLSSDFGISLSPNFEANPVSSLKATRRRKSHSLKPTKKLVISYFSKLSPTYFNKIDNEEDGEEGILISKKIEMEESSCYICETEQPDIILMGCGHGGMCKDCALISIKKNNSCMECRAPVQAIYQIEKEDKEKGRVKACEIFNIV